MMCPSRLISCLAGALSLTAGLRAAPITHEFVAIDEGLSNLIYINQNDPAKHYVINIDKPHPRDLQLEGDGKLLVSTDLGYCEFELATGKLLRDVSTFHDVSSARRLANGHMLLAGVDFDVAKKNQGDLPVGDPTGRHVDLIEFDAAGQVVKRTTYVGDYVRLIRETAQGTYLFACNTLFREADKEGNYLREWVLPGFEHAWKALRLPNGDTLMSSGYGTSQHQGSAFMVEVDPSGKLVRKFGAASDVPAAVHPYFYATFQVLGNGDVVVANWQGHGKGHGKSGVQLLEFDQKGSIVWQWSQAEIISSLQAVLVLDGLDPSKLHDEREGVMAPLAGVP